MAERQQIIAALLAAITVLFVSGGLPAFARWRRPLRRAAIVGYLCVLAVVLIDIAAWLAAGAR